MNENHQALSKQVGAMWTTCNLLEILNDGDLDAGQPLAIPKLSELASAKVFLYHQLSNEIIQGNTHPDCEQNTSEKQSTFLLPFPDSSVFLQSDSELTQSEINDILQNLATQPDKNDTLHNVHHHVHQDEMFPSNAESMGMDNQYASVTQENGIHEYLAMSAQDLCGK